MLILALTTLVTVTVGTWALAATPGHMCGHKMRSNGKHHGVQPPETLSTIDPASCFPMGRAVFPSSGPVNQSRSDWWCPTEQQYGFLGFSYPLESADCSDWTNSYDSIATDFWTMKSDHGATMVRIYAPGCRDQSIWTTLLRIARDQNMGLIPMIWWGFDDQDSWKDSRDAMVAVFNSDEWKELAPYIVHSVAFGSEPIGDGVDGDSFLNDYKAFRAEMAQLGIPVAISEDWDQDGLATYSEGNSNPTAFTSYGRKLADASDLMQVHIMPYYRPDTFKDASDVWPYFASTLDFVRSQSKGQILITETMWASQPGGSHERGGDNTGVDLDNFRLYLDTLNDHCEDFKHKQVGWFYHTWSDRFEANFGLLDAEGKPKVDFWPRKC
ncbi:hypothetical protein IAU60_005346 [Kwoniella sp. DSM 27419]